MTRQTLLILVAVALLGYTLGDCNGERYTRNDILEANAYRLAREARPKREALVKAKQETDRARTALGRAQELVSVREQQLTAQLDSNRVLLSNPRADSAMLRIRLQRTTEFADSLLKANGELRDSIKTFSVATLVERFAGDTVVAHLDKTVIAFKDVAEARSCKVWFVDCPSRKTSFLLGGAVGVVAVLLLL